MVYRSLHGLAPNYLTSRFEKRETIYCLRDSDNKLKVLAIAAQHCGTAFLVKQGKQSPSGNLNISLSSFFEARHSWKAALSFLYFRVFIIVN